MHALTAWRAGHATDIDTLMFRTRPTRSHLFARVLGTVPEPPVADDGEHPFKYTFFSAVRLYAVICCTTSRALATGEIFARLSDGRRVAANILSLEKLAMIVGAVRADVLCCLVFPPFERAPRLRVIGFAYY